MCHESIKELPPEAIGSIAKIFDGQNYAIALRWVAQRPVTTLDPGQRFLNFIGLSLEWKIKLHPFLYWFHPKKPVQYKAQDLEGKSDLELLLMAKDNGEELGLDSLSVEWRELWNKAQRLRMIRAYVWATNAKDKQSFAKILEAAP